MLVSKLLNTEKSDFILIAGPCSVESEEQIMSTAKLVKNAGATMLRGGTYKPRTSPYTFQGLGAEGVRLLKQAGDDAGLPIITEVLDPRDIEFVSQYVDAIQVGSRNMQNYSLLKELGMLRIPIVLKRGMMATVEEWLGSAEYILQGGNNDVILCERGIRGFDNCTRNVLDLATVAELKRRTTLPIIVDPSHATGKSNLIRPASLAAVAIGCDGLEIEVHPEPSTALTDAQQQITPAQFGQVVCDVQKLLQVRKEVL